MMVVRNKFGCTEGIGVMPSQRYWERWRNLQECGVVVAV